MTLSNLESFQEEVQKPSVCLAPSFVRYMNLPFICCEPISAPSAC